MAVLDVRVHKLEAREGNENNVQIEMKIYYTIQVYDERKINIFREVLRREEKAYSRMKHSFSGVWNA